MHDHRQCHLIMFRIMHSSVKSGKKVGLPISFTLMEVIAV